MRTKEEIRAQLERVVQDFNDYKAAQYMSETLILETLLVKLTNSKEQ